MKLDDYAKELKSLFDAVKEGRLPAEEIKEQLGIHDNWPILLNTNSGDFPQRLRAITGYRIGENKITDTSEYLKNGIFIRMVKPHHTSEFNEFMSKKEAKVHFENQKKDYNLEIILMNGILEQTTSDAMIKTIAKAVTDIIPYIPKLAYAACFPYAKDVVYYPDSAAQEIDDKIGKK